MVNVKAYFRTSTKKADKVSVRFRLYDGKFNLYYKSEIEINPNDWNSKKEELKYANFQTPDEKKKIKEKNLDIAKIKNLIISFYEENKAITSEELELKIDQSLHPEKYALEEKKQKSFFEVYDLFVDNYRGTERMKQHYRSVKRILQRFELFRQKSHPSFSLTYECINSELLRVIEAFIHTEHTLFEKHPDIYIAVPDSRAPKQRGRNRTNKIFRYLRTIIRWAIEEKHTSITSFPKFKIEQDVYGTPFYISNIERKNLYNFDLSEVPELAIQRDIFVFQCVIGCRVGDLLKLTKSSIINDAVEYIPRKTKDGRPVTVRVPLNKTSREIIKRYSHFEGENLLPFILEQKYNKAIKDFFKLAGLTRLVTINNPTTGKEEKRPLNEIASSHLARRTFVGNLYKEVKDPNLVGSLTGHKEGSRAFARYRDIDEAMKIDLVNLLD